MKRIRGLRLLWVSSFVVITLCAGCRKTTDDRDARKAFLRSEVAVHQVKSFRAHIETKMLGTTVTDAEYDCGQFLAHYVESNEKLSTRVERIDTSRIRYVRNSDASWTSVNDIVPESVCGRIRDGGQWIGQQRLFTADQGRIIPPFFLYANEQEAVITKSGRETLGGVECDVWSVKDRQWPNSLHTIWIGAADLLPRKYVEYNQDTPVGTVTYSDYGEHIDIEVPSKPS